MVVCMPSFASRQSNERILLARDTVPQKVQQNTAVSAVVAAPAVSSHIKDPAPTAPRLATPKLVAPQSIQSLKHLCDIFSVRPNQPNNGDKSWALDFFAKVLSQGLVLEATRGQVRRARCRCGARYQRANQRLFFCAAPYCNALPCEPCRTRLGLGTADEVLGSSREWIRVSVDCGAVVCRAEGS